MTDLSGIQRLCVIGSGTMGAQIGMASALAGFFTTIIDVAPEPLEAAEQTLRERTDRDVAKGRRTQGEVDTAWESLDFTVDRDAALARADFVIEAAVEDLDVKRQLFADLDRLTPDHAILTTNSSNIVSSRIADATSRPGQVCNMHFFNPALVMKCVEVVPHASTSQDTIAITTAVAEQLGKSVVRLHREIPGFVANRLLNALRREALELYDAGVASFEDIDTAAKTALGHPMGPFEIMDLVGNDVVYLIRLAEFEQTQDSASLPHQLVRELYESGRYGRKTGRGWYTYDADGPSGSAG